ncbi:MAG: hypothetical protein K2X06_10730 [Burkholderiales bacterium]|nr:hypothetical protein [Burkholderiales bacterium]
MREVAGNLLRNLASIPPNVSEIITNEIWSATQYLAGSTTKRIPYEVVYGLQLALEKYKKNPVTITTAIIQERQFRFRGVRANFYIYCEYLLNVKFESELIQIALPEIYRHRPLYNVALYHELGHFIDRHQNLTEYTLLLAPASSNHLLPGVSAKPADMSDDQYEQYQCNHRMEFFADLFAAAYTGRAIKTFLEQFAPNRSASDSHPATGVRLQQIEALLAGNTTTIIEVFQKALTSLRLPELAVRYKRPNVNAAFNNVRPYAIANDAEVHGILEAGTEYLQVAETRRSDPWKNCKDEDVEKVINDLIEKSIRNRMVAVRWENGIA